MSSWGVWWGLGLEVPAWTSLPPAVIRDQEQRGDLAPGSAAALGGVIVTKRGRGTLRPELVLSAGPQRLAQPGGGTYAELYGARWSLALYRSGPRLYQARSGVWVDRTDPDALGVLTADGVRHVALAFDQAARPVLAWERDAQVYVRQWDGAAARYVTRGPWVGCDPVLICDAQIHGVPALSDVLLLHLDAGRAQAIGRAQHDLFAAPFALGAVPVGAVLDQAVALPWRLQLLGEAGREPVALVSGLYPLHLSTAARATVHGPGAGEYRRVMFALDTQDAATGSASGPAAGAYVQVAFPPLLFDTQDAATGSASGPAAGAYVQVAFPPLLFDVQDAATGSASGPAAGAYVQVYMPPILVATQDAATGSASGPTGGTYVLA